MGKEREGTKLAGCFMKKRGENDKIIITTIISWLRGNFCRYEQEMLRYIKACVVKVPG